MLLVLSGCGGPGQDKDAAQPSDQGAEAGQTTDASGQGTEAAKQETESPKQAADASGQGGETPEQASGKEENEMSEYITIAEAKTIVLENAGLSEAEVRFVRVQLNTESGLSQYELEFISTAADYEYKVNALTGEVISMTSENGQYDLDAVPPEIGTAGSEAAGNAAEGTAGSNSQQYIGAEAAKQAALHHAGLSEEDVQFSSVHLEHEDGRWEYEVEFQQGDTEYEFDIDALTGEIISYDYDGSYSHNTESSHYDGSSYHNNEPSHNSGHNSGHRSGE